MDQNSQPLQQYPPNQPPAGMNQTPYIQPNNQFPQGFQQPVNQPMNTGQIPPQYVQPAPAQANVNVPQQQNQAAAPVSMGAVAQPNMPIQQTNPGVVNPVGQMNPVVTNNATTPSVADDVDVIEKEWVDAAKAIVQKTKSDPYQQEEEIEKLQIEYLKKRYGKELRPS